VANEIGEYPKNTTATQPFHKWELSYNLGVSYAVNDHLELCGRINHSLLPVRVNRPFQLHWVDRGQFNDVLICFVKYSF
jgi:hypothetical protein